MIPKDKEPTIIKNNTIAYEADSKAQTNIVITKIFILNLSNAKNFMRFRVLDKANIKQIKSRTLYNRVNR